LRLRAQERGLEVMTLGEHMCGPKLSLVNRIHDVPRLAELCGGHLEVVVRLWMIVHSINQCSQQARSLVYGKNSTMIFVIFFLE